MKPVARIQLSRKKGFRLQDVSRAINGLPAVNCARPAKWGNPYFVWHKTRWTPKELTAKKPETVCRWFEFYVSDRHEEIRRELRGKNLACWCKIGAACHVEILLRIANG